MSSSYWLINNDDGFLVVGDLRGLVVGWCCVELLSGRDVLF